MSGPRLKGVLHVIGEDLDVEPFVDVVIKYELASLEDLLLAHARFRDYLAQRGEA